MLRLNLASGQRPFNNWTNVDIRNQGYSVDIIADVKSLPMIKDNSVDIIVAHHLLEHIRLNDILDTAKEWRRILKPNGKLAVFVPNLKELAKAWIEGRVDNYIFLVNTYGAYQGYIEDTHAWGYDENELRDRLSGWNGTNRELNWGERNITREVLSEELYKDSECALDWWILAKEFTKL
jgi:SAM-dependent methyltransferase